MKLGRLVGGGTWRGERMWLKYTVWKNVKTEVINILYMVMDVCTLISHRSEKWAWGRVDSLLAVAGGVGLFCQSPALTLLPSCTVQPALSLATPSVVHKNAHFFLSDICGSHRGVQGVEHLASWNYEKALNIWAAYLKTDLKAKQCLKTNNIWFFYLPYICRICFHFERENNRKCLLESSVENRVGGVF